MASIRKHSESRKYDTTLQADRESSFHDNNVRWPSSLPTPELMSEAGFYFTPNDKYSDCVTCYRCGIKMFNWLPDDTPKVEHKKFSPSCKEVKSWTGVVIEQDRIVNRAEQTDSKLRKKLSSKAKKFTKAFHRNHSDIKKSGSREACPNVDNYVQPQPTSNDRPVNDEEKLADIRRHREVAEKSLEGLQKLASYYPVGSTEQKRAEQSIVLQTAELEKIREEEEQLISSMGTLSFGRGWHDVSESPAVQQFPSYQSQATSSTLSDEDSPEFRRGSSRPLPQLPSQLRKTSMPRLPTRMNRSHSVDQTPVISSQSAQFVQVENSSSKGSSSEWIEYFTDDGTPYYYSTITKTTVWQIPSINSPVA